MEKLRTVLSEINAAGEAGVDDMITDLVNPIIV